MRTGRVEANLVKLNDEFRLPYVPELIDRKMHGAEKGTLELNEVEFHRREYERLVTRLETEATRSQLPGEPTCRDALNDLLVRVRLTLRSPSTACPKRRPGGGHPGKNKMKPAYVKSLP
jgi:hypothetical protein